MNQPTLPILAQQTTSDQLSLLEADVSIVLTPGSIKGAMKLVNGGESMAPSRDLWQLDPHKLEVIAGLNPRVMTEGYKAHIRTLADSMISEGFFQHAPLAGYVAKRGDDQVIYIYEGGTRLLAAKLAISEGAEFKRVPVSVSQDGMAMEDILVAMVRGNNGRPLSMYESALICKRLTKFGWSTKEIADRLGFSTNHTDNLLTLMAAPHQIRELVATEIISATIAIEMLAEHGEQALDKIMQAKEAANDAGKTRITKKFVPGAAFTKAVKKSAVSMFDTLTVVKSDPAFKSLSEETRTKLAELLDGLEAAKTEMETKK